MSLVIEENTGFEFKEPRLNELSLAVVKLFHVESKEVKATGIIINKKYVVTTYVGADKILIPDDITGYSCITRGNTALGAEPMIYYPQPDGVVLFLP